MTTAVDVLQRVSAAASSIKVDLELAREQAAEQVKIWTARLEAAEKSILALDAIPNHEELRAGIMAPTLKVDGRRLGTGVLRDKVFSVIRANPGILPRQLARAAELDVKQVGSALASLKKLHAISRDSDGGYHPKDVAA